MPKSRPVVVYLAFVLVVGFGALAEFDSAWAKPRPEVTGRRKPPRIGAARANAQRTPQGVLSGILNRAAGVSAGVKNVANKTLGRTVTVAPNGNKQVVRNGFFARSTIKSVTVKEAGSGAKLKLTSRGGKIERVAADTPLNKAGEASISFNSSTGAAVKTVATDDGQGGISLRTRSLAGSTTFRPAPAAPSQPAPGLQLSTIRRDRSSAPVFVVETSRGDLEISRGEPPRRVTGSVLSTRPRSLALTSQSRGEE